MMLDYLQLYPETLALIKRYSKEDRYDLLEAQTVYACEGKEPDWQEDDMKWLIWEMLRLQVDRAVKKVERNRNNARQGRAASSDSEPRRAKESETEPQRSTPSDIEPDAAKSISTNYELLTTRDIEEAATARARETPFGPVELDPVILALQENLICMAMQHYDDLEGYRDILPDDLIIEAVNEAVAHGARTWAYVRSILQAYVKDNIRTVGAARARAEKAKGVTQGGKKVSAQLYEQRDYSADHWSSLDDLSL